MEEIKYADINKIVYPSIKSRLVILPSPNGFSMESPHPKPNIWFRFWYKVLLNWRWEDV